MSQERGLCKYFAAAENLSDLACVVKDVHSCHTAVLNGCHPVRARNRDFSYSDPTQRALGGKGVPAHFAKNSGDVKIGSATVSVSPVLLTSKQARAKIDKSGTELFVTRTAVASAGRCILLS